MCVCHGRPAELDEHVLLVAFIVGINNNNNDKPVKMNPCEHKCNVYTYC